MLLESLRLRGFKSFASTTDLELTAGICVVVGPNGSGKSNVVDALTWVMGVQGARQLRGASMEDVIFSGTPGRPALGRAEVVLRIDNSDATIPVDAPEISIGRVLFRSGESRYTINGEACRLLDVVELLSDAGVGRTFHNVVGQGRIDAILQASPEDRRVAIEEAAGVLKHRKRRERALRRLGAVDADLVRLEDLERELARRLRPLERQVKGAERHGVVTTELEALSLWRAGRVIEDRRLRLEAAESRVARVHERGGDVRADLRAAEVELARLEAAARSATESVDATRSTRSRFDRIVARFHGLARLVTERRHSVRDRLAALDHEAGQSETEVEAERSGAVGALAELERADADLTEVARHHHVEVLAHTAEVTDLEAAWRAAGLDGDDRRAALGAQMSAAGAALDRSEADLARLHERDDAARSRLAGLDDAIGSATACSESAVRGLAPVEERIGRLESLRSAAEADLHAQTTQHRRWTNDAAGAEARAESFEAVLARSEGDVAATDALSERFGATVRVRDAVRVERGAELAVSAALGSLLDAVVIPGGEGPAQAVVEIVKGIEDAVLTAVSGADVGVDADRARVRAAKLGVLSLLEVVHLSPGETAARRIACLVQQHAAEVFVCRDAGEALALSLSVPESVFVTPEGDVFSGGVMTVRSANRGEAVEPTLAAAAARRVAAAADRRARQVGELCVLRQAELESLGEELAALSREASDIRARRADAEAARARAKAEAGDVRRDLESLAAQVEALETTLERERARHAELRRLLDAEEPTATEAERVALEQRRRGLDARGDELQRRSLEIEAERARVSERTRSLRERVSELDRRRASLTQRRVRDETVRRELAAVSAFCEEAGATIALAAAEAERRRSHTARVLEGLQVARSSAVDDLGATRSRHKALNDALAELAREEHEAEIAQAEARLRLEAAEDVARRDLDVDAETAVAAVLPGGIEPDAVEERIESCRKELRRIGPVNPLALQEFTELAERDRTLRSELEDVRAAKREIGKVVVQVDDKIAEILAGAYADVQHHFAHLFGLLFPGGAGRVVLTDPDDVLATGVEIEACPSGKSPKRLSLLSGGERSLAALAYLFAVFRSRPSPFYVLDEVEAALDDINLHRFCNLLREFRRDSQILIVTHQKRTMEIADVIYGVSLGADGTSQILSQRVTDLDLAAVEAHAEVG
ncbi:MAG: chromosome segregation protein SMC [Acidimicrobiia bacterium]